MSPQAGYILQDQILPRLKSAIPRTASMIGSEDAEELTQDSIALAAKMLHNTEQAGKKATPGNIACYTIQHFKSGRRSTGSSIADVLGSGTQLIGRTRLNSLEEVVAYDEETGGEIFLLHDVLSKGEEDPSTKAARKMDWESFMAALSETEQAIVVFMIEGKCGSAMARKLKVSDSTIRTTQRHLGTKTLEHIGNCILIDIQRKPNWKDSLTATKERLACRHERCH